MIQEDNLNSIYEKLAINLIENPDFIITNKDGSVLHELLDASFVLTYPKNCFATCRNMSIKYLEGELEWYMSGSPYLILIEKYSKFWNKVSDDGWSVISNYGKLLLHDSNTRNYTQFQYAKDCLIQNIESKKAVMTIYNKEHAFKSKDNPCTMFLQVLIRDKKIHLLVKMRSSDIWYGLPYDVPFFVLILFKMHKELKPFYPDLQIGSYRHQSSSLHLYDRNMEDMKNSLREYRKNSYYGFKQQLLFCMIEKYL